MIRRTFLEISSLSLAGGALTSVGTSSNENIISVLPNFTSDGLGLTPHAYSKLLVQLTKNNAIEADSYCLGSVIHKFEEKVATALGKEKAIYMPTGTLANHIALRMHCTRRKKALVQQQSHIYRDCGDAIPHLSGINLIPLATNQTTFTLDETKTALKNTSAEKVATGVEAISIETPVRRNFLRRFDFNQMKEISTYAKGKGVAMHLDGARIFGEAAVVGRNVTEYTSLFDTVYLSLYKHFNSIAGAMLAGPAELIEGLHHERRMFGGGLRSAWENVIVADYFFDGFEDRFREAQKVGMTFLEKLTATGSFKFETFHDGTNAIKLYLNEGNVNEFANKINKQKIEFPEYNNREQCFFIKLNESILGTNLDELVQLFTDSI